MARVLVVAKKERTTKLAWCKINKPTTPMFTCTSCS